MAVRIVIPATAFANSNRRTKRQRVGGDEHLKFIRSLPCVVTGNTEGVEAAHISFEEPRYGKLGRGYGTKEDDSWAVPLSAEEHRLQHRMNEIDYWGAVGIDPCVVALALWRCTGDYETAVIVLDHARRR